MKPYLIVLFFILFITTCIATQKSVKIFDTFIPTICTRKSKVGDTISVHYVGKLTNGYKFDSSIGGAPFTFKLGENNVIKGWELGLLNMCEHGKRKLIIPPLQGYGSKDLGDIPPNSYLIFDVELIKISK